MKAPVNLSPQQALVMHLLKKYKELNTHNAYQNGVMRLPNRISELRDKGAKISRMKKDIVFNGQLHEKVGHYIFHGWEV